MIDSRKLRDCLGSFPTGVTIVTTRCGKGTPVGLTVNSLSSVSLDPPLILWCLATSSDSFAHFEKAEHFAVSVLSSAQRPVAERFAAQVDDRFADVSWKDGIDGLPIIEGAVATLECRTHAMHDGGDHLIIVGEVMDLAVNGGEPLVFVRGRYSEMPPAV